MAFFVLCGNLDSQQFVHALYVADYLSRHLPNFKYKKLEIPKEKWLDFVVELNKKNKWYTTSCPIIWKEISNWGGKPYLIGGLGEFWEHCYYYYGLESTIEAQDLQILQMENMKNIQEDHNPYSIRISIIMKDELDFIEFVLEEFTKIPSFVESPGFLVKLLVSDPGNLEIQKAANALEAHYISLALFGNKEALKMVETEPECIEHCDLLLITEDVSQLPEEPSSMWLWRCYSKMFDLAETINNYGKRELKIVFCNEGPMCFMASILVDLCTILVPSNIVVLTADKGLRVLSTVSKLTEVPVSKMGAPPVWGFVGLNEYIDESHIVFKADVFRPYKRSLEAPEGTTLPLGTVVPQLRVMSYLLPDRHEEVKKTGSYLPKVRALVSLLNLWYSEERSDQIISLGVLSNGSFGVPSGLVFSQPAIQDEKRRWIPYGNFPLVNEDVLTEIRKCVHEAVEAMSSVRSTDDSEEERDEIEENSDKDAELNDDKENDKLS